MYIVAYPAAIHDDYVDEKKNGSKIDVNSLKTWLEHEPEMHIAKLLYDTGRYGVPFSSVLSSINVWS